MALTACLDTRFFFAHAEEKQVWASKVLEEALRSSSRVVSSTITITELLSTMGAVVGLETVRLRIKSAASAGIEFIPVSEKIASVVGELSLRTRELPLADAMIAATGIEEVAGRIYTDDPQFRAIPGVRALWGRV